jgi:hypothetical protein
MLKAILADLEKCISGEACYRLSVLMHMPAQITALLTRAAIRIAEHHFDVWLPSLLLLLHCQIST